MSTTATNFQVVRALRFYDATIGKKIIMAVTGFILFGFVVGHLIGNLQVYQDALAVRAGETPVKLNHYAELLRSAPALLWGARIVLLVSVVLHAWAAIALWSLQRSARPIAYKMRANLASSISSRTMILSGLMIAAFVIFHILHLTTGTVHPDFRRLEPGVDVYANVVNGFSVWYVSLFYVLAMVLLGQHLSHGIWSMLQTVGLDFPRFNQRIKAGAAAIGWLIVAGNVSIPLAVMAGFIRLP